MASMKDYAFMMRNTELFMSLFRSKRPVIAKVHGFAVAGGSDIALCSDIVIMAEDALIGYMPARVWGCPTTAMWLYRLGPEKRSGCFSPAIRLTAVKRRNSALSCSRPL